MIATVRRASALRHGYLAQHPALNLALRAYDASLTAFRSRRSTGPVAAPRRLLVCIGGHLGDAVLATTTLPALRAAYPDAAIGVLAPSWSLPAFENHPAIRWRHAFDHWKTNRSPSIGARWNAYRRTAERARTEIGALGYDTAIDLYPFFPNAARILAASNIPTRIGYTSGGGGPHYSHALEWLDDRQHSADRHQSLLRAFLPEFPSLEPRYDLPPIQRTDEERGRSLLEALGVADRPFVVMHPGTGDQRKRWPVHQWRALTRALQRHDPALPVVFTGHGTTDDAVIDEIRDRNETLRSACNSTTLGVLRYLIAHASLLIGVDSVAAHLAAAHDVPCIVIMAAMSDPAHWRPLGPRVYALTNAVPCAPCFRSNGCPAMDCVRGVAADAVERLTLRILHASAEVSS